MSGRAKNYTGKKVKALTRPLSCLERERSTGLEDTNPEQWEKEKGPPAWVFKGKGNDNASYQGVL